jgi:integrase
MAVDQLPSKAWRARFRGPDGRMVSRSFPPSTPGGGKRAAERWEREERARLDREGQAYVDPKAAKVTVTDYARRWVESRPNRAGTTKRYQGMIAAHLVGTPLGRMHVAAVRPIHVQEWATSRAAVLSPSTLDRTFTFLRSVFKSAAETGLVPRTPCLSTIQRPRAEQQDRTVLDAAQVEALVDATPERYRALVVLLATCGLRIGEALGLKVEDIDRDAQVLRVRRQLDQRARSLTPLKTSESRREVPLPPHVLRALAAHRLAFPAHSSDDDLDGLLFTSAHGRPLRYDVVALKVFRPAVQAAGLDGLTPHGLRHHAGSVLLHHGVPPVTVARILGHSVEVLLRTYAHAMPSGEDMARRAMAEAWTQDGVTRGVTRAASEG